MYSSPLMTIELRRPLRFARALALGAAVSGVACERGQTSDSPNAFSSGNSQQTASSDAGVASTDDTGVSSVDPTATSGSQQRVAEGAPCSPVGARATDLRPMGAVPCACVAQSGGDRWVCNERDGWVEGPLPPPECSAA